MAWSFSEGDKAGLGCLEQKQERKKVDVGQKPSKAEVGPCVSWVRCQLGWSAVGKAGGRPHRIAKNEEITEALDETSLKSM